MKFAGYIFVILQISFVLCGIICRMTTDIGLFKELLIIGNGFGVIGWIILFRYSELQREKLIEKIKKLEEEKESC